MTDIDKNNTSFKDYAKYYDLLYQDKNYQEEANYVHTLIQTHKPRAKSILSLGCGTGRYEYELEKLGYTITGVDISKQMIDIACSRYKSDNCTFIHEDIRTIRLDKRFDAVISLFHVMCYQTENKDLINAFKTAEIHLRTNGIFIFDFWHGTAVLNNPPYIKEKFIENKDISILRKTSPTLHPVKNIVEVNFDINIIEKTTGIKHSVKEQHNMRYLFLPELKKISELSSMRFLTNRKWMELDIQITNNTWYGLAIFTKWKQKEKKY